MKRFVEAARWAAFDADGEMRTASRGSGAIFTAQSSFDDWPPPPRPWQSWFDDLRGRRARRRMNHRPGQRDLVHRPRRTRPPLSAPCAAFTRPQKPRGIRMNRLATLLGMSLLGLSICLGGAPADAQRKVEPGAQVPPPGRVDGSPASPGTINHEGREKWMKKRQAAIRAERRRLARDVARQRARANAEMGGNAGNRSLTHRRFSPHSAR